MEYKIDQMYKRFYSYIYLNLREASFKQDYFHFVFGILEAIPMLIVLDVIFRFGRVHANIYYPLYFASPIFLIELYLSNKWITSQASGISSSCSTKNEWDNSYDQISIILKSTRQLPSSDLLSNYDDVIHIFALPIAFSIIGILLLVLQIKENSFLRFLRTVSSFILYLTMKTFLTFLLYLYFRRIGIEAFTSCAFLLDKDKIIQLIFFLLLISISYQFNCKFLQCYRKKNFLLDQLGIQEINIRKFDFFLQVNNSLLLNLRFYPKYEFVFAIFSILLFLVKCALIYINKKLTIEYSQFQWLGFLVHLLLFSLFALKIVCLFLISIEYFNLLFQILEIVSTVLLFIYLFFLTYQSDVSFSLKEIIENCNLRKDTSLQGVLQFYSRLVEYFEYLISSKLKGEIQLKKTKAMALEKMKSEIRMSFLTSEEDYIYTLGGESLNDENFPDALRAKLFLHSTMNNQQAKEELKYLMQIFFSFLCHLKSRAITEDNRMELHSQFSEIIILLQIIIFFCYDETPFRANFYLTKAISSEKYKASSSFFLISSLKYIEVKFMNFCLFRQHYMVKIIKIYDEYMTLLQSLIVFLTKFRGLQERDKVRLIDEESEILGKSYHKINLFDKEGHRIKDQVSFRRYQLVKDILFTDMDYDKLDEIYDIPWIDSSTESNTFFILRYELHDLIIAKVPKYYIELTGIKSKTILNTSFGNILPLQLRESEINRIRTNLISKVENHFEIDTILLRKDGFIVGVNLSFRVLPILKHHLLVICNLYSNSKLNANYMIITLMGKMVNVGYFFNRHFQITPDMVKNTNIFRLFGFEKNIIPHGMNLEDVKRVSKNLITEVSVDMEQANDYINYLRYEALNSQVEHNNNNNNNNGYTFRPNECINVTQYNIISNKQKKSSSVSLNMSREMDMIMRIVDIYSHCGECEYLLLWMNFKKSGFNFIQEEMSIYEDAQHTELFKVDIADLLNGNTSSHESASVLSAISSHQSTARSRFFQKNFKNAKSVSLTRLFLFLYNILLLILSIAGLIYVQISSQDLLNIFQALKNIRNLSFQYFNEAFYVSNVIRIDKNGEYNSYESILKKENHKIRMNFSEYYQEDFRNMTNDFFQMYVDFISNCSAYIEPNYINTELNVEAQVIQLDGKYYTDKFFSILNNPKNTFYIISRFEGFYRQIPVIESLTNRTEFFENLTDNQKQLYKAVFNYRVFREKLRTIGQKVNVYLEESFYQFQLKIIMTFLLFILIHSISFGLYIYDARIFHRKIKNSADKIFQLNNSVVDYLLKKVKIARKLIEMEKKASEVIAYLKKKKTIILDQVSKKKAHMEDNSKEESYIMKEGKDKENTYVIRVYGFVIKLIIAVNMIYVVYLLISFPLVMKYTSRINISQVAHNDLVELQRKTLNFYLATRFSILLNDTAYIDETKTLEDNPIKIYYHFNRLLSSIVNNENLAPMNDFFMQTSQQNASQILLKHNRFYSDLFEICSRVNIPQTNLLTVISFFIRKIRENYMSFVKSQKTVDDIISHYHSTSIQEVNLVHLAFIQNFMTMAKDQYLNPIYTSDINSLVSFSIILFVIMMITEFVNFIIIRIYVVNKLQRTMKKFSIVERFFSKEVSRM